MEKKKKGTFMLITTVSSVVLLAAAIAGILLFNHYAGKSETIQYKNQHKIHESVWEEEPDEEGRRHIVVTLKNIPDEEIPDNINRYSSDMDKLYEKCVDDFLKRNSIDHIDESLDIWCIGLAVYMYTDEKLIRKMAEDELVMDIRSSLNTN